MNIKLVIASLMLSCGLYAQDTTQTFIPLNPTGVSQFLNAHPEYDGRGTVIFVFDTGVDPGVEGLKSTPSGDTKIIDVRDFSGQGDIQLFEAEKDGGQLQAHGLSIKGIDALGQKPADGKYYIGSFNENRLRNSTSAVRDLNGNNKTDDDFIVAVFRVQSGTQSYWVAYFDTDCNGSLNGEKPLRNYRENFDTFQVQNPSKNPYFTFAVNILPEYRKISLYFDDGAHGTHCAGIAAGYRIGKIVSFNGVAPGAKVIAVKISDNTLNGITLTGSMRRAYLFADSLSRVMKEPCIINMSFGIGSVIEGQSEMEKFLDSLMAHNPYLYVCTSNGNNGPGISSSGLPASTNSVLSSGAVLTREAGRDLYGTSLDRDIILHFSARGAETAKPDVCSPGACVSTVPNWSLSDRMWGTSMASPYTAGVLSLLLGAWTQERPGEKLPAQLLYKIIRQSAVTMNGYNDLDQGAGYINAVNAYQSLKSYQKQPVSPQEYTVIAETPNFPGHRAPNLFIRDGSYLSETDQFRIFVSADNPAPSAKHRVLNLSSNADWLTPVQKKLFFRTSQGAYISLKPDMKKISGPGLYTARITAFEEGQKQLPAFETLASVVIPYEFTSKENYRLDFKNEKLAPGMHKRYFIKVPPAAGGLTISLSSDGKNYSESIFRVFDPDGEKIFTSDLLSTSGQKAIESKTLYGPKPGVYEVVVHGNYLARNVSAYELSIQANMLNILTGRNYGDESISKMHKSGFITIANYSGRLIPGIVKASVTGYRSVRRYDLSAQGSKSIRFVLRKGEEKRVFHLKFEKEDYNKFTDFSMLILNGQGDALEKEAMEYEEGEISISNSSPESDSTEYTLLLTPAFAGYGASASLELTESTSFSVKSPVIFPDMKSGRIRLFPYVPETLKYFVKNENVLPPHAGLMGVIVINSPDDDTEKGIMLEKEFTLE